MSVKMIGQFFERLLQQKRSQKNDLGSRMHLTKRNKPKKIPRTRKKSMMKKYRARNWLLLFHMEVEKNRNITNSLTTQNQTYQRSNLPPSPPANPLANFPTVLFPAGYPTQAKVWLSKLSHETGKSVVSLLPLTQKQYTQTLWRNVQEDKTQGVGARRRWFKPLSR